MAEIRNYNGRPAIMVDGKAYPPMMATIRTNARDRMIVDENYYRELGAAGIKIYFLICDTVWLKPQALELFREEAEILLRVCPDALIIPRIGLHPTNEWIKEHPGECVTYSDGSRPAVRLYTESYETDLPGCYSLCSAEWRRDAGKALEETWKRLMALPYADHIIGCFLAAGGTSEWYYMVPPYVGSKKLTAGYSDAFGQAFRKYLRDKYGNDEALRDAWRKYAKLSDPAIPGPEGHFFRAGVENEAMSPPFRMYSNAAVPEPPSNGTSIGSFLDIDRCTDVFDFYKTWHEGTAESVVYFAEVIKKLTPDRLVGAFYGSWGCTSFTDGGTCCGTLKIIDSPYVDFLAAPGVYENRQPGGMVGQREMNDSFTLRNKIYIIEDDSRTHHENRWYQNIYGVFDLTDSIDVMKREFGRTLCEGVQAWWFDQLLGGRRYKDPELYKLIARQQEIAREAYDTDPTKRSEIAYIYDEESGVTVNPWTTKVTVEMHRNYEIGHVGAPVDQYFHNDMARPDFPSYKMYVFFNLFYLTDAERETIRAVLKRDHATALWVYAPGFANPDRERRMSPANIGELTGIKTAMANGSYDPKMRFGGVKTKYFEGFDERRIYGPMTRPRADRRNANNSEYPLYPLFYPDDPDAVIPATFVSSGYPAVAVKEADGFTSVYYGAKYLPSEIVRSVARAAGVHIYEDTDDVLFACRKYVTIHASEPGEKTLRFPAPCSPFELYEEKTYGTGVTEITFPMRLGETKMFRLD